MIDINWSPANVDDAENRVSTTVLRPAETETHWRSLKRGDFLYREGDLRVAFFKLHRGAIALFLHRPSRPNEVIEIAAPGEWVGLGCQERYIESAQVLVDSVVMHVAKNDFAQLASIDLTLREQLASAIKREFESRKAQLIGDGPATPLECTAAFLVSISRQNVHEGRNPSIITDSIRCGAAAALLGFDIGVLSGALLELKRMGLIEECALGQLHIKNIERLERLADGISDVVLPAPQRPIRPAVSADIKNVRHSGQPKFEDEAR